MDVDDFKDAILQLNTKRAKEIRLYYRNLESAIFQYMHHSLAVKDAAIERRQLAIEAKDAEIEELTQRVAAIEFASEAEQAAHTAEVDDLIQNRHVPRRGDYDTVLCFVEKNCPDEEGLAALYPYWVIRCQKKVLKVQKKLLKCRYPDMVEMGPVCEDANAIHCWNRFKKKWLGRTNWMGNQFILPDSAREEFARLFGILT